MNWVEDMVDIERKEPTNSSNMEGLVEKPIAFGNTDDMLAYLRSKKMDNNSSVTVSLDVNGQSKELQFVRHVNPDGTKGGFVGSNTKADTSTYIDKTAIVYGTIEIQNSKIGANSTILSFGKDNQYSQGDKNFIGDTTIGEGVKLQAFGSRSCLVIRTSEIGDDVDINMEKGRAYICRSKVGSGVTTETLVADPRGMEILNIEESEIGKDSKILMDKVPPRLGITNEKIPSSSRIGIDRIKYWCEVEQNGKMPNDPYTIDVPDFKDAVLTKFIKDGEAYATNNKLNQIMHDRLVALIGNAQADKLERVVMLANYVYIDIPYDMSTEEKYPKDKSAIPLDYFIEQKGGICFEHALLLYEILEKERLEGKTTVNPRFVSGMADSHDPDSLHAWFEVEIDGEVYIVDPTNPMPYTIAGKRGKNGEFIRFYAPSSYDYVYDGQPSVSPL